MSEQPRRRRRQQIPNDEPVISSEEPVMLTEEVPKTEIIAPTIPHSFSYDAPNCDTHTKTGLLEYIKTAIELETDLATQERILAECHANIESRKPILKLENLPSPPQYYEVKKLDRSLGYLSCGLAVILFIFIFGACATVGELLFGVVGGGLFSALFGFWGWAAVSSENAAEDENNRLRVCYDKERKLIEERNKEMQSSYWDAVRNCKSSYNGLLEEMQPHIDETRSILSRLYSKDFIYPKYRNFPALTSIYEYFMTGRCEELSGPHGAYNLYEDELRKDTVISQLNTVIENLEQIKQNQYMLYEQVCAIQQNTAAIRSELAQIKGYTIQIA